MSRYALEWAKAQNPGDSEAKLLLLVLADHAEGPHHSCSFINRNLTWATDLDADALCRATKRLEDLHLVSALDKPSLPWTPSTRFELLIPKGWRWTQPYRADGRGACDQPTAVYRFFDAKGVLLYVGISVRPELRFPQHELDQIWWYQVATREIVWYLHRYDAEAEEQRAIREEQPVYNIRHASGELDESHSQPKRPRYVKENGRYASFHGVLSRFRAELAAGLFDVGPLPSLGSLANRYRVASSLMRQVREEVRRSGDIAHIPAGPWRDGVYYRVWSEW